jgi:signal transduction histidine kinase
MRATDRLIWDLGLLDAQEVLQGMLDGVPMHLALVGRDGTILATNDAWDRFCQENDGDLVACGPEASYLVTLAAAEEAGEPHAAAARRQVEAALAGQVGEDLLYRCDAPDEERTFRSVVVPVAPLDAALIMHTSVTDERLAAQLHDELLLGLSGGVRSELDELDAAATELVERPSMLRDPRVDALATRIARSTHQLQRLVAQLLDLQPVLAGSRQVAAVPLGAIVADVLGDVAPAGRSLSSEVPRDLLVRGDPARLALALEQLVTNAVHHTPPGSRIVVHTEPEDDDRVLVLVDDDGPGVPRYERDRLRRPFERGLLDRRGGAGLGLPIVDQLLRLDGERLLIDDRPGGGARFGFPVRLADERDGPA